LDIVRYVFYLEVTEFRMY